MTFARLSPTCAASGERYTSYANSGRKDSQGRINCPVCGKLVKLVKRGLDRYANHIPHHHDERGVSKAKGSTFPAFPGRKIEGKATVVTPEPQQAAQAVHWNDRAIIGLLNRCGDGPFGEEDVQAMRRALKHYEDVRAEIAAPQQVAPAERVYLVATGRTNESGTVELYERHDKFVPLADCEVLYTAPQQAAQDPVPADVARLVLALQAFVLEWGPLAAKVVKDGGLRVDG